jgi:gluconokinase
MPEAPIPEALDHPAPPLVVVMGVSGSGKTTVGAALAQRLRVPFADADDFHPQANIAKMSAGIPLDDADRGPWLEAIAAWLAEHSSSGGVASCSALKRSYRDVLSHAAPHAVYLHLHGDRDVLAARVAGRPGHFMPAALIDSQFATLEVLQPDELGAALDVDQPVDALVDESLTLLKSLAPKALAPKALDPKGVIQP